VVIAVASPWTSTGIVVFDIAGDLDRGAVPRLRSALGDAVRRPRVVIDVSGVGFVDSVGLGGLIGCIRRIHERGGNTVVVAPDRVVGRLLHTVGLDRLTAVVGSRQEAAALIANASGEGAADPSAALDVGELIDRRELDTIRCELRQEFPASNPDVVDDAVKTAVMRFAGARVAAFVPLLVWKAARRWLRGGS